MPLGLGVSEINIKKGSDKRRMSILLIILFILSLIIIWLISSTIFSKLGDLFLRIKNYLEKSINK